MIEAHVWLRQDVLVEMVKCGTEAGAPSTAFLVDVFSNFQEDFNDITIHLPVRVYALNMYHQIHRVPIHERCTRWWHAG